MQKLFNILEQIGNKRTYQNGEILFLQGAMPTHLYLLLNGKVRLYKTKEHISSTQLTLHILSSPQFIAEMPFFMQSPYPANAECASICEIITISQESFHTHCLGNSEICLLFITSLCKKIQILESHIALHNQSLQEKVLSYLSHNKDSLHALTQRHIANALNIAPESLSHTLKTLKTQGILTTHKGKITLL